MATREALRSSAELEKRVDDMRVELKAAQIEIEIDNPEFRLKPGMYAKVSFTVERGEIFVLMGPSGSGKSVLLKHIIGLEEADAGELLIEGQSIHTEGLRDRYRMAMVFQSGALLNSLTVGENVGLYLREHRRNRALVDHHGLEGHVPRVLPGKGVEVLLHARMILWREDGSAGQERIGGPPIGTGSSFGESSPIEARIRQLSVQGGPLVHRRRGGHGRTVWV